MSKIIGTIITDCADANARTRQELRFKALFGVMPSFLGVGSYSPVEAAGNLIDQLDVLENFPSTGNDPYQSIVLLNVAPRGEDIQKKWDNGTPFCYFRTGSTLVVSTYEGSCLTLARDLGITSEVALFDIPTVTAFAVGQGLITREEADRINDTQFRSLEFLPLVAYWVWQDISVPSTIQSLDELPSNKGKAWHVDNFDNVKTTLFAKDIDFSEGEQVTLSDGETATCYKRLADVPKGITALTIGSSGYGSDRFLEVVIGHRGKASSTHKLTIGSSILAES